MVNLIKIYELQNTPTTSHIKELGHNCYEISKDSNSITIEVLELDLDSKYIKIRHNHRVYSNYFKDSLDDVLDKMGIDRSSKTKDTDIKAPMPGKVIEIIVKEGDQIEQGGAILILEAMKMENVLKAENDCIIKKILISNQDNVEKNQILVELD